MSLTKLDWVYARCARRAGVPPGYSSVIIDEAKRANIPRSLGFALVQTETNFHNIYGHDPVENRAPKGGHVTKHNYLNVYLPDRKAGKGMQGVGPCQLTWYELQDQATKMGGCWEPRYNMRVAFNQMHSLIKRYGYASGVRRYNGSGQAAINYSALVRRRASNWKRVLLGASRRYPA